MGKAADYIKGKAKGFIDSFRNIDRSILYVVVYDLVFFLTLVAVYRSLNRVFMKISEPVLAIGSGDFQLSSEAIKAYSAVIDKFYINAVLYSLLFILIIIAVYSLTNLLIWSAITSTNIAKQKRQFFLKYSGLSVSWIVAWIVFAVLLAVSLRKEAMQEWFIATTLLYGHLTTLLYISFFRNRRIGKSIKSAFGMGFSHIHKFIAPYIFAALAFFVINIVVSQAERVYSDNIKIAYFIVFLLYFAWLRIYIYSFAGDMAK